MSGSPGYSIMNEHQMLKISSVFEKLKQSGNFGNLSNLGQLAQASLPTVPGFPKPLSGLRPLLPDSLDDKKLDGLDVDSHLPEPPQPPMIDGGDKHDDSKDGKGDSKDGDDDDPPRPKPPKKKRQPQKRIQYSRDALDRAFRAYYDEKKGLRQAARIGGIPASTLHDHIKKNLRSAGEVTKPGPKTYLSNADEKHLVKWIMECQNTSFCISGKQVMEKAMAMCKMRGVKLKSGSLSHNWLAGFVRRHPELSTRRGRLLDRRRDEAEDPEVIRQYFMFLGDLMMRREYASTWNADATTFSQSTPESVSLILPQMDCESQFPEFPGQVRLLGCVSSKGVALPPLFVIDPTGTEDDLKLCREKGIPDSVYIVASVKESSRTVSEDAFHKWFTEVFIKYVRPPRPNLLILGSHWTHFGTQTLELAKANDIDIVQEPSNCSRILSVFPHLFSQLKRRYRNALIGWKSFNGVPSFSRWMVPAVLKEPWRSTTVPQAITNGWKQTGLAPLNVKIPLSRCKKASNPLSSPSSVFTSFQGLSQNSLPSGLQQSMQQNMPSSMQQSLPGLGQSSLSQGLSGLSSGLGPVMQQSHSQQMSQQGLNQQLAQMGQPMGPQMGSMNQQMSHMGQQMSSQMGNQMGQGMQSMQQGLSQMMGQQGMQSLGPSSLQQLQLGHQSMPGLQHPQNHPSLHQLRDHQQGLSQSLGQMPSLHNHGQMQNQYSTSNYSSQSNLSSSSLDPSNYSHSSSSSNHSLPLLPTASFPILSGSNSSMQLSAHGSSPFSQSSLPHMSSLQSNQFSNQNSSQMTQLAGSLQHNSMPNAAALKRSLALVAAISSQNHKLPPNFISQPVPELIAALSSHNRGGSMMPTKKPKMAKSIEGRHRLLTSDSVIVELKEKEQKEVREQEERIKRKKDRDDSKKEDEKEKLLNLKKRKRRDEEEKKMSVVDRKLPTSLQHSQLAQLTQLKQQEDKMNLLNPHKKLRENEITIKLRRQKKNNTYCLCEKGTDLEDGSAFWVCLGPKRSCPCNGYVHKKCAIGKLHDDYCPYCFITLRNSQAASNLASIHSVF